MSIIDQFLRHTISVERKTGTTAYGEDIYDDPAEMDAFVQPATGLARTPTGEEVTADTQILTRDPLTVEDMVSVDLQLPGGELLSFERRAVKQVTPQIWITGDVIGFQARL